MHTSSDFPVIRELFIANQKRMPGSTYLTGWLRLLKILGQGRAFISGNSHSVWLMVGTKNVDDANKLNKFNHVNKI